MAGSTRCRLARFSGHSRRTEDENTSLPSLENSSQIGAKLWSFLVVDWSIWKKESPSFSGSFNFKSLVINVCSGFTPGDLEDKSKAASAVCTMYSQATPTQLLAC